MAHGVATSTNLKLNAASLAPEKLAEVTPIWAAGLASTPHPIFQGFFLLDVGEVVRELCILQICGGWIENHQMIAWGLKFIVWKHRLKATESPCASRLHASGEACFNFTLKAPIACGRPMYFRPFIRGVLLHLWRSARGPPCWSIHPIQAVSPGHSDELRLGTLPTTGAFGTQRKRRITGDDFGFGKIWWWKISFTSGY